MRSVLSKPSFIPPMLPSLVVEPPKGERWIHEIKHDGYRTLLVVDDSAARAWTRNRNDWTTTYPAIVAAAAKLRCKSAIIDGEVICPGEDGRSDFHGIRSAIGSRGRGLVFIAFDRAHRNPSSSSATTVAAANRFIREVYLPAHNARFAVVPAEAGSAFVPVEERQWRNILCIQEERTVAPDNIVAWKRQRLQIPPHPARAPLRQGQGPRPRISRRRGRRLSWTALPRALATRPTGDHNDAFRPAA